MASMTDALGKTKLYTFSSGGKLIEAVDAKGGHKILASSSDSMNGAHNEYSTFTSPMGKLTSYQTSNQFDGVSYKINTLPSGYWLKQISDFNNSTETFVDALGLGTTKFYDAHPLFKNRRIEIGTSDNTQGGGYITTQHNFTVDPNNSQIITEYTLTSDLSNVGSYVATHNKATRTATSTTPAGRTQVKTFDATGNLTSFQAPGQLPVYFYYNTVGQLTSVSQGSRSYVLGYNNQGLLSSIQNPLNQTTHFSYDAAGQLISQTLANNAQYQFTYNGNGQLMSIINPNPGTYSYGFDDNQNLNLNTEPMIGSTHFSWSWSHNADDQILSTSRPDATTVSYTYDNDGNLSTLSGPGVNRSYGWTNGFLQSIATASNVNLTMNPGVRPSLTQWSGTVNGSVAYSWGDFERLTALTVNGTLRRFPVIFFH